MIPNSRPFIEMLAWISLVMFPQTYLVALSSEESPPALVLHGASVFDSTSGLMMNNRTVVVENNQITAVVPSEPGREFTSDSRIMDLQGKYIIPGLIDAHVHLVHLADRTHVTGDELLPLFLAAGVTAVRSAGDAIVAQVGVAHYARANRKISPRIFMSSPLIDRNPPLHADVGYPITDPEQVAEFVRDMKSWNVRSLKIYVGIDRKIGKRVIDEAHLHGLKVIGHLGNYSAQDAVTDGIDCLEHIWSVFNYSIPSEVTNRPNFRSNLDLNNPRCQSLVNAIAKRKVAVDPTLVVFRNMIYLNDLESVHMHPDLDRMPHRLIRYWESYRRTVNLQANTRKERRNEIRKYQELTGILYRAGVPILVGTDAPEPFVPPGYSIHQELELLVQSGMPPAAVLQSATRNNARIVGSEDDLGRIAPGYLADMVILSDDPTVDIRNTRRIEWIVHDGLLVRPEELLKDVPME